MSFTFKLIRNEYIWYQGILYIAIRCIYVATGEVVYNPWLPTEKSSFKNTEILRHQISRF